MSQPRADRPSEVAMRPGPRILLLVSGLLLGASPEARADPDLDALERAIGEAVETHRVVGAAVALVDEEGVFWARGFGWADREARTPATPETLFRAGSVSKVLTGLLAMRMVEAGVLDLEAPLRSLASEVEHTNRWSDEHPVRLVHLLEHTTGWDDLHFSEYRSFPEGTRLADGLADHPASRTSRWPPGRYPAYCNAGPAVFGYVLEKITGLRFEDLARRELLEPLGMRSATFAQRASDLARLAKSYRGGEAVVPPTRIWASPSGALAVSARELGRVVELFLNRGRIDEAVHLTPASIERIEAVRSTLAARQGLGRGYGLGNYASHLEGASYRGHDGAIDGFSAALRYREDAQVGFVILANTPGGTEAIERLLARYLASRHPPPPPLAPRPGLELTRFEGIYRRTTPRYELLRFLGDLSFVAVTTSTRGESGSEAVANELFVVGMTKEPVTIIPVGTSTGTLFALRGEGAPSLVFYEGPGGVLEIGGAPGSTLRKTNLARVLSVSGLYLAVLVAVAVTVLTATAWAIGRAFGHFRGARRWRVWALPALATIALVGVTLVAVRAWTAGDLVVQLGSANGVTRSIQLGSLAYAACAFLGAATAPFAPRVSGWARWPAFVVSLVLSLYAAYLMAYGLIGLTVWAYVPRVWSSLGA